MDRELLIEIGVEELPAAWLPGLTKQLAEKLDGRLREMRMVPDVPVESYSTPRRLTAFVGRMPERQEDLDETVTGPPVSAAFDAAGEPTPAALGFAKKQGVPFESLERTETPKGTYLVAKRRQRGKSAVDALPELLAGLLRNMAFPKEMHWDAMLEDGRGELTFGRPIRWLLFLYGGRVVPYTIARMPNAAGSLVQEVTTGAVTYGHRFLATSGRAGRSIKVRTFDDYRARLNEHFVILEHSERRDRIARELELKARKLSGRVALREHASLVDEVADLVEYPGVVAGFFERTFLELPHEVLTTTLVHHQHYFPVVNEQGALKEAFLAVVNTQPQDERLIAKNAERVVTARLRDARFFWEADRRTKLADRLDRLHTLTFHKKLPAGQQTYRDKAQRIEQRARAIVEKAFGRPDAADAAAQAARLAKADLTTDMVFEFPELQGVMGGIYAREEGLPEQVWKAIYYHYLPVGVEADAPPSRAQLGSAALSWAALSLADKIDTVVGLWSAGEKVSGSRDPFGLRRGAQGIVRILVDLENLTGIRNGPTVGKLVSDSGFSVDADSRQRLLTFFVERLRHLMQTRGLSYEEIQTVTFEVRRLDEFPLDVFWRRAAALQQMRNSAEFGALASLFKRAANLVDSIGDQTGIARGLTLGAAPGAEGGAGFAEIDITLFNDVKKLRTDLETLSAERNEVGVLKRAAELRPRIDQFFEQVMVIAEDETLRRHRVGLLADLVDLIRHHIGEISFMVLRTE